MESLDKLPNSLIEMMVVLGLDDTSALDSLSPDDDGQDLFSARFEPQILAALSRHVAVFPPARHDDSYPPQSHNAFPSSQACNSGRSTLPLLRSQKAATKLSPEKTMPKTDNLKSSDDVTPELNVEGGVFGKCSIRSAEKLHQCPTMRYMLNPVDFVPRHCANTTLHPAQFPLSNETLASLTSFCFPDNFCIHSTMQSDTIHYLALTNVLGRRTYAVCLTQFAKHSISKVKNGSWKHISKSLTDLTSDIACEAYIPCCYVVISRYPYFTTLKDCLSRLTVELRRNAGDDWQKIVKDFVLHLCMTPSPLCGNLRLKFQLFDTIMTLPATLSVDREPVDFDMSVIFKCLDVQSVLTIVTAILTQQRIVFVSSSYPLLTLVTKAFLHLIFPFLWQLTYVPVLPLALLELLEAPGTFIMGCHSNHRHFIDEIEDLIVVSLDDGVVQFTTGCLELTLLPKHPITAFKEALRNLVSHLDLWQLETPRTFSYEDSRATELDNWHELNDAISDVFLTLLSQMFAGVFLHVDSQTRFFNRGQFLDGVSENERPFYEKVFVTELFSVFLKSRLDSNKHDEWSGAVSRVRSHTSSRHARSLPSLTVPDVVCHSECPSPRPAKLFVFQLPNFMYSLSDSYTDACIKEVSHAVDKEHSADTFSSRQPALLYIRAMLLIAQSRPVSALGDLCQIHVINSRLFPSEFVDWLLSSMSDVELTELEQTELYARSPILSRAHHSLSKNLLAEKSIVMELYKIPERHIDLEGFTRLLRKLLITLDEGDTARRLFNALTLNRSDVVDPVTFQEFYKCWKQNEVEVRQVATLNDLIDPSTEVVIKVSRLINCSFGTGRVILTQDRLLHLQEGSSRRCREIVRLLDIRSIDERQEMSITLKQRPALRITVKDGKKCSFSFREETHCWHLLINEMWSGRVLSEEQSDPLLTDLALHNVLIVDAFLHSGEAEFSSHHHEAKDISSSLCYFTAKRAELSQPARTSSTRQSLVHYVKVVEGSSSPQAVVECLLYTSGKSANMD